jgi:hypothetical protein
VIFHAIGQYCANHPLAFSIYLFILAIPFNLYAGEIRAFIKVPPQKISTWIAAARLVSARRRLAQIEAAKDLKMFIMRATLTVIGAIFGCSFLIISIIFQTYGRISVDVRQAKSASGLAALALLLGYTFIWRTISFRSILAAVLFPKGQTRLEGLINRLEERLRLPITSFWNRPDKTIPPLAKGTATPETYTATGQ